MSTQAFSAPISSLSLLHVQTQAARWKAAAPEQLTGVHLYLHIAKSGYLFHGCSGGMNPGGLVMHLFQRTGSALVQVMACHLFGAKPLPELMLRCLLLLISMLWHRQVIFESKGDMLSSSAECRIRTRQGLRHQIASKTECPLTNRLSYRGSN